MNDIVKSPEAEAVRAANSLHGEAKAFIHITGYSMGEGFRKIEALLKDDKWRECGFATLANFADSIRFDADVRLIAEKRKKFVGMFEEANKREAARGGKLVSNRKLAKTVGANRQTVANDLGENSPPSQKKNKENNGVKNASGEFSPSGLSGGEVSKLNAKQERKELSEAERKAERAEYEARASRGCEVGDLIAMAEAGRRFNVMYADPNWEFKVYSGKGKSRSAERHYDTSSIDAIKALPVGALAADDCALFLWCVMPELPGALEVIKAWGFAYKTAGFVWVKQNKGGEGLFTGMGYWTRANAEMCLFATKGEPKRIEKDVHQVVIAPVAEHSRKPDEVRVRIERLLVGPYLELFGRRSIPGWTVWGNEIEREMSEAAE